jgi:hypothetical protein
MEIAYSSYSIDVPLAGRKLFDPQETLSISQSGLLDLPDFGQRDRMRIAVRANCIHRSLDLVDWGLHLSADSRQDRDAIDILLMCFKGTSEDSRDGT